MICKHLTCVEVSLSMVAICSRSGAERYRCCLKRRSNSYTWACEKSTRGFRFWRCLDSGPSPPPATRQVEIEFLFRPDMIPPPLFFFFFFFFPHDQSHEPLSLKTLSVSGTFISSPPLLPPLPPDMTLRSWQGIKYQVSMYLSIRSPEWWLYNETWILLFFFIFYFVSNTLINRLHLLCPLRIQF